VVDPDGRLFAAVQRAAAARNAKQIFDDGKQVKPRFTPVAAGADTDAKDLSDRVRRGSLFAYVVIGKDALDGGADELIAYHSDSPTYEDLPKWLDDVLNAEVHRHAIEAAHVTPEQVHALSRKVPVRSYGLVTVSATGEVKQAKQVNKATTFGVPFVAMFLLFMLVMMAAPVQLNNILEEKMQRIAEVLVSSVSAFELFLGKLLGAVFVSWTLAALYLGGVWYVARHYGFSDVIPPAVYAWFLLFQLLALLIYGSIFSALGAACSELRDAQSMMMPAMLLVLIPMFVWTVVLKEPNSGFSTVMSLIPPATPFLMLLRVSIPPGPPLWELGLGLVLTIGFTLLCVWAGGKIFRIGILAQGQTPSFRKLIGWVLGR
jgi:ABC-type Na+ efflux pump permease subunit